MTDLAGAAWLTSGAVARLLAVLNGNGEEARVVGGAVRNALLGVSVGEVDLATTAVPEEVVRRVEAAGFKAVPTGIEHGTVTVVIDGTALEVTTLRRDVETDGRHAKVAFGRDWKDDAQRRDFTINALSASPDGTIHDYTGGRADLERRKVRFIGDAKTRIAEDYLRILRFFRFHAAYGENGLDPEGLKACIESRAGLTQLSRERVRMEFVKLLVARGAEPVLQAMADGGFLLIALNSVSNVVHFARMVAAEDDAGLPADAMRRLAALAVTIMEDAERLSDKLRLSNAESARLISMVECWRTLTSTSDGRELLYRRGPEKFADAVLLAWTRASDSDAQWKELAALPKHWTAPHFPIKAADLMALNIAKGPKLGAALGRAERAWIAAGFPDDESALAKIAAEAAIA
ncbi:MAG: CCA tRNA nucleotidyltransferase [Pseudolabrys sp.]|nr:CCA tRNA nucleotidyltransferase [Pseudolabrys sp.]